MAGAVEIKDRTSNVRMSLSSQGEVFVDALSPLPVSVLGSLTPPGITQSLTGTYVFSVVDAGDTGAANNYVSLFNPLTSGVNLVLLGGSISCYVGANSSSNENSMQALRTTTATGGTLQAATAVCKFQSTYPNPAAEVRTGNPTTTNGANFVVSPPAQSPSGATPVHTLAPPSGGGLFTLIPGEGIVLRTAGGDTDRTWNINLIWGEGLVI